MKKKNKNKYCVRNFKVYEFSAPLGLNVPKIYAPFLSFKLQTRKRY